MQQSPDIKIISKTIPWNHDMQQYQISVISYVKIKIKKKKTKIISERDGAMKIKPFTVARAPQNYDAKHLRGRITLSFSHLDSEKNLSGWVFRGWGEETDNMSQVSHQIRLDYWPLRSALEGKKDKKATTDILDKKNGKRRNNFRRNQNTKKRRLHRL